MSNFLAAGTKIDDRYEIISLLGQGGLGSVYKAKQDDIDRTVAIKFLHISSLAEDEERFRREGLALAAIRHENIPQFYHFGICTDPAFKDFGEVPFIVMEYLQGSTLRAELSKIDRFPWQRALQITRQIAEAMNCAHRSGIVHRDLKPENIMLVNDPEADTVKVCDFGLAKFTAGQELHKKELKLTGTGIIVGSVNYLSPEQCLGKNVDQRSDIYSLACMLYELIYGEPPFSADTPVGVIYKHINEKPNTTTQIKMPAGLRELLSRSLAKEAANRYQSMQELIADLDLLLANKGGQIKELTQTGMKAAPGLSKAKAIVSIIAIAFVAILVGQAWQTKQQSTAQLSASAYKQPTPGKSKPKRLSLVSQYKNGNLDDAQRLLTMADQTRDYELAEKLQRQALPILEKIKGTGTELAIGLWSLAYSCTENGKPEEAKKLLDRAVVVAKAADCEPILKSDILHRIGATYRVLRCYKEANACLELALAKRAAVQGSKNASMASIYGEIGRCFQDQGDFSKAEKFLRQAVEAGERSASPSSALESQLASFAADPLENNLQFDYSCLASVYSRKHEYDKAITLLNKALAIRENQKDRKLIEVSVVEIASNYASQHKYKEAEQFLRSRLDLKRADARAIFLLAELCATQGKKQEAELLLQNYLQKQALSAEDKLAQAEAHMKIYQIRVDRGKLKEASTELLLAESLLKKCTEQKYSNSNLNTHAKMLLADCYSFEHKTASAERLLEELVDYQESAVSPPELRLGPLIKLADNLLHQGRAKEALPFATRALELTNNPETKLLELTGLIYKTQENWTQAELFLRKALAVHKKNGKRQLAGIYNNSIELASICTKQKRYEEAYSLLAQSLELQGKLDCTKEEKANLLTRMGIAFTQLGKTQDAKKYLLEAEPMLKMWIENDKSDLRLKNKKPDAFPYFLLADNYDAQGKSKEAAIVMQEIISVLEKSSAAQTLIDQARWKLKQIQQGKGIKGNQEARPRYHWR